MREGERLRASEGVRASMHLLLYHHTEMYLYSWSRSDRRLGWRALKNAGIATSVLRSPRDLERREALTSARESAV